MEPDLTGERIETARLRLEPLTVEHADVLHAVLDDPALHAFIGGCPETPAELRARYRRWAAGSPDPRTSWCNWAAFTHDGHEPVGTCQATVTDGLTGEIAYVVGTAWQRRGLAREMACGLVGWLGAHGVRRVIAHVHPDHHASAAVAASAGLTPTPVRVDGEVEWERLLA
jgi:RimJ/RimL family protein N-acetyltransferase